MWHTASAKVMVKKLRLKEVTPLQLIDLVEKRVATTDLLVHATPITCFNRARRAATQLKYPKSPPSGYLYGLPVLIKDLNAVEDVRWTNGLPIFRDRIACQSDPMVLQLEAMGAIVVGKTNVPEFCAGSHCFNSIFPTTTSPYDTRSSAGGSSGGSAAALASCQVWLASGSDLGGSLRIPAAFCGVVGFRTTPGRIPEAKPLGFANKNLYIPQHFLHSVNGPMARTVQDVALFLDALTQSTTSSSLLQGWKDDLNLPSVFPKKTTWQAIAEEGTREPLKFRVLYSTLGCPISEDVNQICQTAAKLIASEGGVFEVCTSPFNLKAAERCFFIFRAALFGMCFNGVSQEQMKQLKPEIRWNYDCSNVSESKKLLNSASKDLKKIFQEVKKLFSNFDILITPATLDGSFDANIRYPIKEYGNMESKSFDNYLDWMMPSCIVSSTSCPALVMPAGSLTDGRPVGIQLVGQLGNDAKVLRISAALEAALKLNLRNGCPVPRRGTSILKGTGPNNVTQAEEHHASALKAYMRKYCR